MRLIDAPVGLFMYKEALCLKTEYMNRQGGVEAYVVESGDVFWGGAKSQEERNNLDVTPVSLDDLKPHGRWVCPDFEFSDYWKCSACDEEFYFEEHPDEVVYNYCPNCGAKMDGGDTR